MSAPTKAVALITSDKFDSKEIALLRETYAQDLNDTELKVFLKQCESMDLNPFTKEIYGMVISGKLVLITSIGGLRKIAHQSGDYAGCSVSVKMDGNAIHSARAVVKKIVKGHVAEFEAEVLFKEYNTGKNNWAKMPVTMIKKCAEAAALRMAFPSVEMLYEEGELGAIQRKPKTSAQTEELTEKFKAQEAKDVTPYPDHHEDLPLTVTKPAPAAVEKPVESVDNSDYVIPVGVNTGKKLKELTDKQLEDYITWAYKQENLSPKSKEYLTEAEKYLEKKQGEA